MKQNKISKILYENKVINIININISNINNNVICNLKYTKLNKK